MSRREFSRPSTQTTVLSVAHGAGIDDVLVLPVAGSWHQRAASTLVVSTTTFGDEQALLDACRA